MASFFLSERLLIDKKSEFRPYLFLKKRFGRILIPLLFWTIFYALTDFLLGIKDSVEISPVFGWTGQYFFIVLSQLTLIYPLLRRLNVSQRSLVLIIIANLTLVYVPISYFGQLKGFIFPAGESSLIFWISYVSLGVFLARNYGGTEGWLSKGNFCAKRVALAFACAFLLIGEQLFLTYYLSEKFTVEPYTYSRISVLFSSVLIFLICLGFNRNSNLNHFIASRVSSLSKWSLGIFCLNPFLIDILNVSLQISEIDFNNNLLLISVRLFLSAIICIVAIMISRLFCALGLRILVQ